MTRRGLFTSTSNPILNERAFSGAVAEGTEVFTVQSAISKTFVLFAILLFTAVISFRNPTPLFMYGGAIGGLVVVVIAVFKKSWSPILAPLYAGLEGLFVGGISAIYAAMQGGIILKAVSLTLLVFLVMLVLFKTRIIPVTNKLRTGIMMATGAIFLLYLITWILSMFNVHIPYVHEGGGFGILLSIGILGIAAMNLLLDFDLFEQAEMARAPRYMEWFAGMGLLVTVVWIYIEVLRLLSRLRN